MAKILGSGAYGTAYLIDGYVIKLQKIFAKEKKRNMKYPHWREIDAMEVLSKDDIIAKHIPELIAYKTDSKLPYIHPKMDNLPSKMQREIELRNQSPFTFAIKMSYVGQPISDFSALSQKSIITMMLQLITLLYDINSKGYSHNDIHPHNILRAAKPCNLTILGETVSFDETYYIIDFGLCDNPKISGSYGAQKANSHQDIAYLYMNILLENRWDKIYASYIRESHPIINIAKECNSAQKRLELIQPSLKADIDKMMSDTEGDYYQLVTAAILLCYTRTGKFKKQYKPNHFIGIENIIHIHHKNEHLQSWLKLYHKK